jgi:hypothetical protein
MTSSSESPARKILFEFLVIVVGVLTAFGVQSWSESRSQTTRLNSHLRAIREELTANVDKMDIVVQSNDEQSIFSTDFVNALYSHAQIDSTLIREVYLYKSLSFKLGSYEALKTSSILDQVRNIELIRQLNNLSAQVESTLEFQRQVETIYYETMIYKNGGAVDLVTYKPLTSYVYSQEYIDKVRYLSKMRGFVTSEIREIGYDIIRIMVLLNDELAE